MTAQVALTSDDLHWFDDAFRAWENNDFVGVLDGLNAAVSHFVGTAKTILPDPCPGCERGAVCRTPTCGRIRSSELMGLYGTAIEANDAKDAARYRWLREQEWFSGTLCVLRDPKRVLTSGIGLGADCPSYHRLDAAIDAAMSTHQPKESGNV